MSRVLQCSEIDVSELHPLAALVGDASGQHFDVLLIISLPW